MSRARGSRSTAKLVVTERLWRVHRRFANRRVDRSCSSQGRGARQLFDRADAAPRRRETDRRAQYREIHLKKAWDSHARGELILGGALADPVDGAVLLFSAESRAVPEEFARTDPYVINGIVRRWYVREWTTVAGTTATTPVGAPSTN